MLPPAFSPGLADYLYGSTATAKRTQITYARFDEEGLRDPGFSPVLASQSSVFGDKGKKAVTIERSLDPGTYAPLAVAVPSVFCHSCCFGAD